MAAGSIRVTMEVGADGVALITIANPPVNALHPISKRPTDASFFLGVQFFRGFAFGGVSFLRSNPVLLPNLSPAVIAGLKEKYAEAMRRDDVKAIVLTGQISHLSSSFISPLHYLIWSSINYH